MDVHGQRHEVSYWPGDSKSGMFGGNSNWRGPICMCQTHYSRRYLNITGLAVNFLLIESLQRFYQYYGDDFQVNCICLPFFEAADFLTGGVPNW
jgi:hypothetical protein